MGEDEPGELLLINHFKGMGREEKENLTVYFSPKYNIYVFRYKSGEWGIGSSLSDKKGFLYWHSKLGRYVISRQFDIENMARLLDRKRVVTIDEVK